jgi:hypothetical protein
LELTGLSCWVRRQAGDDAAHADFYDVEELKGQTDKMAFDHALLLHDLLEFVKKHNIDIPRA